MKSEYKIPFSSSLLKFNAIATLSFCLIHLCGPLAYAENIAPAVPDSVLGDAFSGREGTLVIIDCSTGLSNAYRPEIAAKRIAPCSTFKIWNALIGLETGVISDPGRPFYKWDGKDRPIAAWNRDLTLREAFQSSCVPAFQDLARRIGAERMRSWIDKIGYGDRDISAGIDVFWLPERDRKTILISPAEQAKLVKELVAGTLPFSKTSISILKDLMAVRKTDKGALFGKTGSGADGSGKYVLGWFVGYVESKGSTFAFACIVNGDNMMGKDARAIVESVLEKQGLL